jgi:hypothetical protein
VDVTVNARQGRHVPGRHEHGPDDVGLCDVRANLP